MNASGEMFGHEEIHATLEGRGLTAVEAGERMLRAVQMHAAVWVQRDNIVLLRHGRTG
jgi:hypothetical protein